MRSGEAGKEALKRILGGGERMLTAIRSREEASVVESWEGRGAVVGWLRPHHLGLSSDDQKFTVNAMISL